MSAKRKYLTDKELEELVDQSNADDEVFFLFYKCFINTRRLFYRPYDGKHPIASYLHVRIAGDTRLRRIYTRV